MRRQRHQLVMSLVCGALVCGAVVCGAVVCGALVCPGGSLAALPSPCSSASLPGRRSPSRGGPRGCRRHPHHPARPILPAPSCPATSCSEPTCCGAGFGLLTLVPQQRPASQRSRQLAGCSAGVRRHRDPSRRHRRLQPPSRSSSASSPSSPAYTTNAPASPTPSTTILATMILIAAATYLSYPEAIALHPQWPACSSSRLLPPWSASCWWPALLPRCRREIGCFSSSGSRARSQEATDTDMAAREDTGTDMAQEQAAP